MSTVTASSSTRNSPMGNIARRGYAVVRKLFDSEEIETIRATAMETMEALEMSGLATREVGEEGTIRVSRCDVLSMPLLRRVLLDSRLLAAIGGLLGDSPHYFGDSSLRIGKSGDRAWHRDNVDRVRWRKGPDWLDPYPLLRCGLYLQDQSLHSGGLALRPRSNRPRRLLPTLPKLVTAEAGDLVAWDLRTVHSGEAVRPAGLPRLALNPRLQSSLPERLRAPDERERIVIFMTFGLPSAHLENFVAYGKSRDYMQDSWANSRFQPEVWQEAKRAGLKMVRPIPEYGTPPED